MMKPVSHTTKANSGPALKIYFFQREERNFAIETGVEHVYLTFHKIISINFKV